jgi:hypothetical protein
MDSHKFRNFDKPGTLSKSFFLLISFQTFFFACYNFKNMTTTEELLEFLEQVHIAASQIVHPVDKQTVQLILSKLNDLFQTIIRIPKKSSNADMAGLRNENDRFFYYILRLLNHARFVDFELPNSDFWNFLWSSLENNRDYVPRILDKYEECQANLDTLHFQLEIADYTGWVLLMIAEDCGEISWENLAGLLIQERRKSRVLWSNSDVSELSRNLQKLTLHGKLFSSANKLGFSNEEIILMIKFHQTRNSIVHRDVENVPLDELGRLVRDDLQSLEANTESTRFVDISDICKEALKKSIKICYDDLVKRFQS